VNSAIEGIPNHGAEARIPGNQWRVVRSIQFRMSMYLAAILGLCALTTPSVAVVVFQAQPAEVSQETQPPVATPSNSPQDSTQNGAPPQPGAEPQASPSATPQATPAPEAAQEPHKPQTTARKPESQAKVPTKKRRRRKSAVSNPTTTPEKKVVRNGGTAAPAAQLGPSISAEQASNQRQNTSQLLAATDANLKQISSRPMNSSQQESVSQIRKYMEQAKTAEQGGDVQRAHNLASKALLLSDDLAKQ
jgi:outer membrane biosynthesis protein TonB